MKTEMNHTPGPWTFETVPTQIGHAHKIIPIGACLYVDHRDAREKDAKTISAEANARLIAAAPELLEACKAAKKHLEPDLVEPGRTVFWKLVEAIKKSTGGAQ